MSATVCEMNELYLPQWQFSVQCVSDKTKLTQKISTFHNISDKFMIFSHFISLQMSYDFRRLTHPFVRMIIMPVLALFRGFGFLKISQFLYYFKLLILIYVRHIYSAQPTSEILT